MDLITGLPSRNGKNAILTIVDNGCSRAAIFLPCSDTITGPGIAQLYLDNVYRWFGLPTKMISDRDPCFTSHFGKALMQKLGVQQNLSTAFHPQTDGLSEHKNQWVEQYLQLVTSMQPEDWTEWLSMATAVHNYRKNATTGVSPNQVLLGYDIPLIPDPMGLSNNEGAEQRLDIMKKRREQAIEALNLMANKTSIPETRYKLGDQVWLEATHLRLPHQKSKLVPKRMGPFRINKVVSPVAYQLALPVAWRIHDVFHASLLSPYHETQAHGPNFSQPPLDLIDGEEEYEVEWIAAHRYHGKSRSLQYLIKWKGYPEADSTWEPADQIHAPDLLKTYHQQNPLECIKGALLAQSSNSVFSPLPTSACLCFCSNSIVPTVPLPPRVTMTSNSTSSSTPSNVSTSVPCVPNAYVPTPGLISTFRIPTSSALPSSIVSDLERCLITMPQLPITHSDAPSVQGPSVSTRRFKPTSARMPQSPSVATPALTAHLDLSSIPRSKSTSSLIVRTRIPSYVPSAPVPSRGTPTLPPISKPTTIVACDVSPVLTVNIAPTDTTIWNCILSCTIRSSVLKNNVSPGRVESSLPSDGIHHIHSLHSITRHSSLLTKSNQTPRPTLRLNEVIQSRRSIMKLSSSITRRLQALMRSMMGRSDERSRSGYDGLIQSLMGSVIDGKRSRSSHQGLMRSLMEISD